MVLGKNASNFAEREKLKLKKFDFFCLTTKKTVLGNQNQMAKLKANKGLLHKYIVEKFPK